MFRKIAIILAALAAVVLAVPHHHNYGHHQGRPESTSDEQHFGLGNQGQFHHGFPPQPIPQNPQPNPETPVDPETPEDEILDLDNVPSVVPQTRFCNLTASLAGAPTTNPALTFIPLICLIFG